MTTTPAIVGVVFVSGLRGGVNRTKFIPEKDGRVFPNPERGFYAHVDLVEYDDAESAEDWARQLAVDQGYRLAFSYVRLDDYRASAIPTATLNKLRAGLAAVRDGGEGGLKIIMKCSYNFPTGSDYMNAQDASIDRVLQHIKQLAPIYDAYSDVIAIVQAGYVGAWGEWHSSSNDLTSEANKRRIYDALIAAVPADRMVQLRYPFDLMDVFYPAPVESEQAYNLPQTPQARTGFHNDCFLASDTDSGTYWPIERRDEAYNYLTSMTQYVAVGGETCAIDDTSGDGETPPRTDCPVALKELELFHWSYLNEYYHPDVIQQWRDQGCYNTIARKLGYRYHLKSVLIRARRFTKIGTGDEAVRLKVRMVIKNNGWAVPFNPRPAYLVVVHQETNAAVTIALTDDIRPVFPAAGRTKAFRSVSTLVDSQVVGERGLYELYLHLPDPAPGLATQPSASIRLANKEVWQQDNGHNLLGEITI